jgi:hypothetical protein
LKEGLSIDEIFWSRLVCWLVVHVEMRERERGQAEWHEVLVQTETDVFISPRINF